MQIRTLLLFISIAGSAATALTVWYTSTQREATQMRADAELRWDIYNDSWHRIQQEGVEALDEFGPSGKNQSFGAQRRRTAHHKCVGTLYGSDVDYTNSGIDSIANPSFEASRRAATNPWKPIDFCYSLARRCSEKHSLFSHPGRDL